ncbi:ROK family transcriptional regulator [Listeria welshimeri]|uniref:Xylose repressor n=1 Tax=Listeria welshimeri serovar 6b (strain ATCC 35897 / DSM 20650 / CCUG 15529 / CIP 8149 / NCTC 11857 / SLCC 5334 / V8) TaxID=386043 RepID=A0AF76_LISW6|nr:ROK family transcriptional regulator [Listeria welshimeri]MBC1242357.1 ROK family transcriptional regulator [Listeria welshimeri]MBC1250118.1 ROK family transcriptional regulator [Listeria welshimeri]MBC1253162.1 ROK family transcriptional regulator [Listeria welshimeri]MBC1289688.1 ROK family transcriptional regulator [Listeria welshimeri]MBC1341929.1 ROK family transcriptional regulator [Listeria welshimeri]
MFTNRTVIRESNERIVLNTIAQKGPHSRALLSDTIGLNKATISDIVKKLIAQKLINEVGIGESTNLGGRKPIMLELNAKAGFSVSVDIGYNYIDVMAQRLDGTAYKRELFPFIVIKRETIIQEISDILDVFLSSLPKSPFGIVGILIAIHGVVLDNQIQFTPAYDLAGLDFSSALHEQFACPVYLENEANLLAVSDHTKEESYANLVSISIHSGIGSGVILNNELYTGINGYAGEIGHMQIVTENGRPCPCGASGCLECYASEKNILDTYQTRTGNKNALVTDLCRAFTEKEEEAMAVINDMVRYLATGIQNLTALYNPEIIFINSEISRLIPDFTKQIESRLTSFTSKNIAIKESHLGEEAILYGAGYLIIQRFLAS